MNSSRDPDRMLITHPPPYNGVSFVRASCPFLPRAVRPMLPDPGPPQTHLADDPLETSKHCIKEKAARLRGLPFLAYSCSGGAKMTLARGGSKPAVVRGHLASKTAYVCRFSSKKRATRRVRGFFWRFWAFGAPKSAYVCRFSLRKARKCGYVCKKGLLEASGDPRRTYKLAPGTDPPSPFGLQIGAGE